MKLTIRNFALVALLLLSFTQLSNAQNLGIGTDFPDANAILDIVSNDRGILIPRLTTGERVSNLTGLGIGQEGLLIYNTTNSKFNYWDGANWIPFPGGDADWYEASTVTSPTSIASSIYTNGNVGIGTNSPTQALHIANSGGSIQSIIVEDMIDGGNAYNPSTAVVGQSNRASVIVDKTNGQMYAVDADDIFWRLDGNADVTGAGYSGNCPNLISTSMNASGYDFLGTRDNADMVFATNDIERGRFLRDGQMVFYGKGTSVPASSPTGCVPAYPVIDVASFYATGDIYPLNAYSEGAPAVYGAAEYNGTGIAIGVQGAVVGDGDGVNGHVSGTVSLASVGVSGYEGQGVGWAGEFTGDVDVTGLFGYYNTSDARLKKNIQRIKNPIERLMRINGVTYSGNMEEYGDFLYVDRKKIGVIAQDVNAVFPELVRKAILSNRHSFKKGEQGEIKKEEFLTVNYDGLIPVLIEATKEQQKLINDLEKENQRMKAMLLEMKERLDALE